MADSKISGLPAVAAFATTQEFPVNDSGTSRKISGAQLIAALPQGTLTGGNPLITANQTGITTEVDVTGSSAPVTAGTGRRLRITGYLTSVSSTVSGDFVSLRIYQDGVAIQRGDLYLGSISLGLVLRAEVTLAGVSGAHTYKLTIARGAGTGTITIFSGASNPSYILVEDIGV